MEGETKTARIDQKSTLFYFLFFLQKIQDIRESKTSIFERGSHKNVLGQVLTIFQTSPKSDLENYFFFFIFLLFAQFPDVFVLIFDFDQNFFRVEISNQK